MDSQSRHEAAGQARRPIGAGVALARPVRWIGSGLCLLGAVLFAVGIASFFTSSTVEVGQFVFAAVTVAVGFLARFGATRLERGAEVDITVIGAFAFGAFGVAAAIGGIVLVFDDPAGFVLIGFGLVFVGAGYLTYRLFRAPPGKRTVEVAGYSAPTRRGGVRHRRIMIAVDENADEAEVAAARQAWIDRQWRRHPDWVAGRIQFGAARGKWFFIVAGVLAAGAVVALVVALTGDDEGWFGAGAFAVLASLVGALGIRNVVHHRKFGVSTLVLDETPVMIGARLAASVETGVAKSAPPADGFRLRLQCIHRWESSRGTGSERKTTTHNDVLWEHEWTEPAHSSARHAGLSVPVSAELPAEQPATTLGSGSEGIRWELRVTADMPGLDYSAWFVLPVLAAAMLPSPASARGGSADSGLNN